MHTFPKVGDKLEFIGVPQFYYPHFTNIGEYARNNLVVGQIYVASKVAVHSSWCEIELEGHGNNFFNLMFFKEIK